MSLKVPVAVVPPKSESGGCSAIVRPVSDFELPEVILYVAMKVACSPDWNFESKLDPDEPDDVVVVAVLFATVVVVLFATVVVVVFATVVVVELAAVVVVVPVLELLQPAARSAATVANAKPAAMRLGLEFLASLIMWILRPLWSPATADGKVPQDRFRVTAPRCDVRLPHRRPLLAPRLR
jgi:hypothetical protein